MDIKAAYELWLNHAGGDEDLINELNSINGNDNEIFERFYTDLKFGTAGLRGIIGAGTNRMNIYTVRRATQGLANFLNKKSDNPSVAISYDSRIKADLFAQEAARVLAANGIKAYISTELQPTPVVSFAVRELKTDAGIMVTASHNPAKYNGYKCYGSDGCQMTDVNANAVFEEIQKVDYFNGDIKLIDFEEGIKNGLIEWISDSLYETYLDNVQAQSVNPSVCSGSGLKVVYTPLNGAGNKLVRKVLARIGVENIVVVPEQELPDGNFTTCPYPNPEIKEALRLGLELSEKEQPDLLLATDPDSDRVGIAVKVEGGYRLMSGNETGIMLINYILSGRKQNGTLPEKPVAVKTIVTSKLVERVCEKYGCELKNVLTGFKYIGEQILLLEQKNEQNRYVFGFEESYGYLAGTYVRDKDAVVASMLICEMAAYYRTQGKTLDEVMNELYQEFGYYINRTEAFEFEGSAGMQKMADIMSALRNSHPTEIAGFKVTTASDYLNSYTKYLATGKEEVIDLPKSNVLAYSLEGGGAAIVRPSGTEPKIKVYITAVGKSEQDALVIADNMVKSVVNTLGLS
ncbi:MAG: phospho-sugar mutase [Clostridia bacterium]|nr:phospho-sugar mutase [Clostridia bacterium]MBR2175577.1 phospho-sugar mutase [Clostridia bacterium]